jgi:hypothetical protein
MKVFLGKEKQMVKDGCSLRRLEKAVSLIRDKKLNELLSSEDETFEEKLLKNQIKNEMKSQKEASHKIMKITQKDPRMIGYI